MALSETAGRILADAAQHPLRLAASPDKLPAAAARAVLNKLLKQGYVEECDAPDEFAGLHWHQQDGARLVIRITEAGMDAIGAAPTDAAAVHEAADDVGQTAPGTVPAGATGEPSGARLGAPAAPEAPPTTADAEVTQQPATRPSLRDAAHRVLAAWDDAVGERVGLPDAIAALRAILVKPAPTPRAASPRKPREGTKQQQVLAMLRRPEGATVAQIAEATSWQAHTVRGLFAGLKKRQGIVVVAAERICQVGPDKQGAKGSYSIYRIAEAV